MTLDKSVTVEIDGQARTLHTYSRTVSGMLRHAHLVVGEHDTLAPSADAGLKDGSRVVIRRGREVTLRIDGKPRLLWVTAMNVDEIFTQIGLRTNGAYLSASRSRPVGLDGLTLDIRMPHRVEIVADGKAKRVITNAATVKDLLADAKVAVAKTDKVSVPLTLYPSEGLIVRITRIRGGVVTESYPIPHATDRIADSSQYVGQEYYTDNGADGVLVRTYDVTFTNGEITSKQLKSEQVVSKPRTAVVRYGTKPLPYQESCQASWYGLRGMGAAHRTLPFGTRVRVVNVDNGLSVTVTINDRGPFVAGRCIDLDEDAFAQIASTSSGVANVRLYY